MYIDMTFLSYQQILRVSKNGKKEQSIKTFLSVRDKYWCV